MIEAVIFNRGEKRGGLGRSKDIFSKRISQSRRLEGLGALSGYSAVW